MPKQIGRWDKDDLANDLSMGCLSLLAYTFMIIPVGLTAFIIGYIILG